MNELLGVALRKRIKFLDGSEVLVPSSFAARKNMCVRRHGEIRVEATSRYDNELVPDVGHCRTANRTEAACMAGAWKVVRLHVLPTREPFELGDR